MRRPPNAVSRAYYTAYAAVTEVLPRTVTFPQNRNNPSHEQLPSLVSVLRPLDKSKRRDVRQALSRLRNRREDVDYRPRAVVDRRVAKDAVRDASLVLSILELESDSRMDTQGLIDLVRPKLATIAPRVTRLDVVEAGVRQDGSWWYVPVKPEGENVPPPDFLYPRYATVRRTSPTSTNWTS